MRRAALFNAISLVFLLLTLLTIAFVVIRMASPSIDQQQTAALPTFLPTSLFPTDTPTLTHTPSFTPTIPPSLTPTFTLTPSITNTLPPPTVTFTPTGPTITPTLMPPTLNPYVFGLREPVNYTANAYNSLGCSWQGIGGQVFDLNGIEALPGQYQVRVFDTNFTTDKVVAIGSNTLYGAVSGWEAQVAGSISNASYFVRLETNFGTAISENVPIQFTNDCARNLAIVKFGQLREP